MVALLCSCTSRQTAQTLDDVEGYIQQRPDSALTVLERIPRSSLHPRSTKAKFSLLYAMALDKNYIDTTDLSVIEPAVEYYRTRGSAEELAKSLLYLGRVQQNRGELEDAILSYNQAVDLTEKSEDLKLKALLYSSIADVYNARSNDIEAVKYNKLAARFYKESGNENNALRCNIALASSYGDLQMFNAADSLFSICLSEPIIDSTLYGKTLLSYSKYLAIQKQEAPQKSLDLFEKAVNEYGAAPSFSDYCTYSILYALDGKPDLAGQILDFLETIPDLNDKQKEEIMYVRYHVSKQGKDYETAIELLEDVYRSQDETIHQILSESVANRLSEYYHKRSVELKNKQKIASRNFVIVILSLLFAVLCVALVYTRRNAKLKRRNNELALLAEESESNLKEISAQADEKLAELRSKYSKSYKSQFKVLNDLCREYWLPSRRSRKDRIYEKVQEQLYLISEDVEKQEEFEREIDKSLDGIMNKFRSEFPNLKSEDYRFISYVVAGFDSKTIACILGMSVGSIYVKKSRVKSLIEQSQSKNKELFLAFFS